MKFAQWMVWLSFFWFTAAGAQPQVDHKASMEVSCGDFYVCQSGESLKKLLAGKTVNFKHPRSAEEFGTISLTLRANGWAGMHNARSSANGTWEVKEEKLVIKVLSGAEGWSDFNSGFLYIGPQLFIQLNKDGAPHVLLPVELTE